MGHGHGHGRGQGSASGRGEPQWTVGSLRGVPQWARDAGDRRLPPPARRAAARTGEVAAPEGCCRSMCPGCPWAEAQLRARGAR